MTFRCLRKKGACAKGLTIVVTLFILSEVLVSHDNIIQYKEALSSVYGSRHFELKDVIEKDDTDKDLIGYIQSNLVEGPSKRPYNLTNNEWPEEQYPDQCRRIDSILKYMKNGTFVEIGAKDGEDSSMTLYFELFRKWSGLLVEPDPSKYRQIKLKARKAATINACLRKNKDYPMMSFGGKGIPCLSMTTFLLLLKTDTIDLLSINVRGDEINVLKSVPYSTFHIRLIIVQFSTEIMESLPNFFQFMSLKGFKAQHQYVDENKTSVIFINKKDENGSIKT